MGDGVATSDRDDGNYCDILALDAGARSWRRSALLLRQTSANNRQAFLFEWT
jgi:hypothetical protein